MRFLLKFALINKQTKIHCPQVAPAHVRSAQPNCQIVLACVTTLNKFTMSTLGLVVSLNNVVWLLLIPCYTDSKVTLKALIILASSEVMYVQEVVLLTGKYTTLNRYTHLMNIV